MNQIFLRFFFWVMNFALSHDGLGKYSWTQNQWFSKKISSKPSWLRAIFMNQKKKSQKNYVHEYFPKPSWLRAKFMDVIFKTPKNLGHEYFPKPSWLRAKFMDPKSMNSWISGRHRKRQNREKFMDQNGSGPWIFPYFMKSEIMALVHDFFSISKGARGARWDGNQASSSFVNNVPRPPKISATRRANSWKNFLLETTGNQRN